MRRFGAFLILALLLIPVAVQAWTLEDCIEVNFDHPDCDQYTTTTQPTTTQPTTTTQPEVTTTTAEVTTTTQPTTTTTPNETTTTQPTVTTGPPPPPPTTATTVEQCPEGTIHQPPLCVPAVVIGTVLQVTAPETVTVETLPFTGADTSAMGGLAVSLAAAGGLLLLGTRTRKADG